MIAGWNCLGTTIYLFLISTFFGGVPLCNLVQVTNMRELGAVLHLFCVYTLDVFDFPSRFLR